MNQVENPQYKSQSIQGTTPAEKDTLNLHGPENIQKILTPEKIETISIVESSGQVIPTQRTKEKPKQNRRLTEIAERLIAAAEGDGQTDSKSLAIKIYGTDDLEHAAYITRHLSRLKPKLKLQGKTVIKIKGQYKVVPISEAPSSEKPAIKPKVKKDEPPKVNAPRVLSAPLLRSRTVQSEPELDPNRPGLYPHIIPDKDGIIATNIERIKAEYRAKYPNRKRSNLNPTIPPTMTGREMEYLTEFERTQIDRTALLDLTNIYLTRLVMEAKALTNTMMETNPHLLIKSISSPEEKTDILINTLGEDNLKKYVVGRILQGIALAWSPTLTAEDLQERKVRTLRISVKELQARSITRSKATIELYSRFDLDLPENLRAKKAQF